MFVGTLLLFLWKDLLDTLYMYFIISLLCKNNSKICSNDVINPQHACTRGLW